MKYRKNLTHAEIAKALGVSRSYVSRLCRQGMPQTSTADYEAWIAEQANETGSEISSQGSQATDHTLADWRKFKLRLECQRIEHDLEQRRIADACERIPVTELEKFIVHFCNFSRTAFTVRAEELVNEFVGKKELEILAILRRALDENTFATAASYLADDGNQRVAEKVRKFVRNTFIVSDQEIDEYLTNWMKRATTPENL